LQYIFPVYSAVGSTVGQIAKIKRNIFIYLVFPNLQTPYALLCLFNLDCKVIGFAGTEDKLKWMKDDLKFDYVFNYKQTPKIAAAIREVAPQGVDYCFDNVRSESIRRMFQSIETKNLC